MNIRIPFNRPAIVGAELTYLAQSIAGGHTSGDGPFTKRAQSLIEEYFNARRLLLTNSCTSALEIAAHLCELGPGDEVILPSYTFVSTANAVVLRGATPVFVDVRPDTLNIDERLIESAITDRTRAIFPVHYAGVACEMDTIMAIAQRYSLWVVEDAAQGVSAKYRGRWLGTIGHMGCYSFHETKNVSCGEGGALIINDSRLEQRAEIIREKGTNRSQFLRGKASMYTWIDYGSSYALSDMLAAFLVGQLENISKILARRRELYHKYADLLAPLVASGFARIPVVPSHCEINYHMFYVMVGDMEKRDKLINYLNELGILAIFHYVPLHSSPFAHSLGITQARLPVTEDVSRRLLRLPMFFDLTDNEVAEVAGAVLDFFQCK